MDGRNKFQDRPGLESNESVNRFDGDKEAFGKLSGESCKRENHSNVGRSDAKPDATGGSTMKQDLLQDRNGEKYKKRFNFEKYDHAEIASGRGNSLSLPPAGGTQNKMLTGCPCPVSGSQKGNRADRSQADDALKNSGSNVESTALYFQAALKFLHSASLIESGKSESNKHGEMIQSVQMYSSTAKLCEFCAHEYERLKDVASASLAYKCMEVACMRVIYSSHANASRDRHELQTTLQMVPPGNCVKPVIVLAAYLLASKQAKFIMVVVFRLGESPSSSASDVDNLNHPTTADKVAFPKGLSSPQVAGNHVISARNRPSFVRLLNFRPSIAQTKCDNLQAQDMNHAMEASRKSQSAFTAANFSLGGAECGEAITSVKKALDYNFQDVEGVLRLFGDILRKIPEQKATCACSFYHRYCYFLSSSTKKHSTLVGSVSAALSWNIPMTNEEELKEYKKNGLVQNYSGRYPSKHKHIISDSQFGIWKVLLFVGEIVQVQHLNVDREAGNWLTVASNYVPGPQLFA
ncbi:hypothetical protein V6N11_015991 [Hibiscus sabdariffa]|uniref:CWZF3/5/7 THD domain-containing protein n=1 Tax=Hibiscus sabdariffa TaxID=183260 RepID=A0ABR2TTR9_9ROSI